MPRSLRIEKENGIYHIINRGNYRQDLFIDEGAHESFQTCLFEACEKCEWLLEGFCVMTNHFHLVIRTPRGNMIYGLKWLQSTFANRYHRFRKEHGKLFQGRYKSLIVEEADYLGSLLHYTHLNPVRAGMTDVDGLRNYRWSSYWYLQRPAKRPPFLRCTSALSAAGGLTDTNYGRKKYADYLKWLSSDEEAQKEMAFEKMCRGWALGSRDFKNALIEEAASSVDQSNRGETGGRISRYEGDALREVNELLWERALKKCMEATGKTKADSGSDLKSAAWKIMIAAALKQQTSATNGWIARALNMGVPHAVSRYTAKFRQAGLNRGADYKQLIAKITE